MELGETYFWTDTIKDWKCLLKPDKYKEIIIEQLQWLSQHRKIVVYGYVIMPNHLHLLWEMLEKNGKELPSSSFNKWTGSRFLEDLRKHHPNVIPYFSQNAADRNHQFLQRDPKAILTDTRKKAEQMLDYIHLNLLQEHWNLVQEPEGYRWSSASFYNSGIDEFNILTHYLEKF